MQGYALMVGYKLGDLLLVLLFFSGKFVHHPNHYGSNINSQAQIEIHWICIFISSGILVCDFLHFVSTWNRPTICNEKVLRIKS